MPSCVNYSRALYLTVAVAGLYALYTTDSRKRLRILLMVVPLFAIFFIGGRPQVPARSRRARGPLSVPRLGQRSESGASWRARNAGGDRERFAPESPREWASRRVEVEGHRIEMHSIFTEHLRPAGLLGLHPGHLVHVADAAADDPSTHAIETMVLCAALLGVLAYGLAHSTQNMLTGWVVIGLLYHLSTQPDASGAAGNAAASTRRRASRTRPRRRCVGRRRPDERRPCPATRKRLRDVPEEPMKLLIVDNGWIRVERERNPRRLRERGEFLLDCGGHFDGTTYLCSSPSSSLEQYRGVPLEYDRVRTVPVPARGRRWSRLLSYLCNFRVVWRAVRESDFLYVFFPGNVPLWSVAVSRFLRKPYGVYLRGELGKNSRSWRWTMSGAAFVIAVGTNPRGCRRRFCDDVELAIPHVPAADESSDERTRSVRTEGPWRLLYVGRLEERKGTPELLDAMTLLDQRGVDFRLDLVGQNYLDHVPEQLAILADRINASGS